MMRNIAPETYCLKGEHLFAHVGSRTRFAEVLRRSISSIVCMPIAGILKKIIKHVWQITD